MRGGRPIRLTFVQPYSRETNPYGNRYWGEIFRAIRDVGFDLRVINPRSRPVLSTTPFSFHCVSPRVVGTVRATRPEVVLAVEYGLSTLWSIAAARSIGAKVLIFQEHGGRGGTRTPRWARLARAALLVLSHGVVANSPGARADAIRTGGVSSRAVFDIPILSPPVPGSNSCSLGKRERRPPGAVRFLFVGELTSTKNVQVLLRATATLASRGKALLVEIAGDGPLRSELEAWVRERGLQDRVAFLGFVPYERIGKVYERNDVFVMPTLRDYRSIGVQEAMRFSMPVIDSVHDGNAGDMIRDQENGFLIDPSDPFQLADRMDRFILSPDLVSRMGMKSLSRVENITPERAAAQLSRVISRLVS